MLRSLMVLLAVSTGLGAVDANGDPARQRSEAESSAERRQAAVNVLQGPVVVDIADAGPLGEGQVEGEVLVANRTQGGEPGFLLMPEVRVGTPWNLELGAAMEVANLAGEETTSSAVSVAAVGQLVAPRRYVPQLSLEGRVRGPLGGGSGLSAEAALLATQSFGLVRVHGNAFYTAIRDEADEYLLGVAVDRPLGTRVLVKADTYYLRPLGDAEATLGAGVGAGLRLGQALVLTGSVNLAARAEDVTPRLLLGVYGFL